MDDVLKQLSDEQFYLDPEYIYTLTFYKKENNDYYNHLVEKHLSKSKTVDSEWNMRNKLRFVAHVFFLLNRYFQLLDNKVQVSKLFQYLTTWNAYVRCRI